MRSVGWAQRYTSAKTTSDYYRTEEKAKRVDSWLRIIIIVSTLPRVRFHLRTTHKTIDTWAASASVQRAQKNSAHKSFRVERRKAEAYNNDRRQRIMSGGKSFSFAGFLKRIELYEFWGAAEAYITDIGRGDGPFVFKYVKCVTLCVRVQCVCDV